MYSEQVDLECQLGVVKKFRDKNSSLSSSVGLSADERYLVITSEFLHCFRKEPVGSFVFENKTIRINGTDTRSNNLAPYASISLGTQLNFCRAYDTSSTCRVFELQDSRPENADRVYAFEAASSEELRDRWLHPIDRRHQSILRQDQLKKLQRRLAATPEYVKLYDSDSKRGPQECRNYFRAQLEQCYSAAEGASDERGKRQWGLHLSRAEEVLAFLEQIAFETTIAPVTTVAEVGAVRLGSTSVVQKESPLGRIDVLVLAFEEAHRLLVKRFRPLLFDDVTVAKLENYDTRFNNGHDGTINIIGETARSSNNAVNRSTTSGDLGGNSEKTVFLSSLPLSSDIVVRAGLSELHTLVAFIIRYQNRLRAIQTTATGSSGPGHKGVVLPTHCEVFDYLPCLYERYINGLPNTAAPVKVSQSVLASRPSVSAPTEVVSKIVRRGSGSRRSAPAPPTTSPGVADVSGNSNKSALPLPAGDIASSDGAAAQILDHCSKVWTGIRVDPVEAIARHIDGTFYTEGPTAVWVCLQQHIALGRETNATVLQVLIAEKIAIALNTLFERMCTFVTPGRTAIESSSPSAVSDKEPTLDDVIHVEPSVREVEMEFLCAITNDCGIHLDEVLTIVGGFNAIESVKRHVDKTLDTVSTALMRCASASLRRLVRLVLADVDVPYSEVFTQVWLELQGASDKCSQESICAEDLQPRTPKSDKEASEKRSVKNEEIPTQEGGMQVLTILRTLGDYLEDFKVYLVQFWYDKFSATLFTQSINTYIDSIISQISHRTSSAAAIRKLGNLVGTATPQVVICTVDARSIAKIRSDMTAYQQYISRFNRRTVSGGGTNPAKYTELLNMFCLVLECNVNGTKDMAETALGKAITVATQAYNFAAPQLSQFLIASFKCRPDLRARDRDALIALTRTPEPAVPTDSAAMRDRLQRRQQLEQAVGIVLALNNFVATSIHVSRDDDLNSSNGQGLLGMATSSLFTLRGFVGGGSSKDSTLRHNSSGGDLAQAASKSTDSLSDDVQRLVREHEAQQLADMQASEKAESEASAALDAGFLRCSGFLDKRQDGSTLWQRRFLQIQSRKVQGESADGKTGSRLSHLLLWYKRQQGVSLGSIELSEVCSLMVMQYARPLEFIPSLDSVRLAGGSGQAGLPVASWRPDVTDDGESDSDANSRLSEDKGYFVARIIMRERDQSFDLRAAEVDVFVRWVNTLAVGASISYDTETREWSRIGRENLAATTAAWRKQGVLAQKEEVALSAIQMAKAQQRKEKLEREKLHSATPGSAAALIAETRRIIKGDNVETLNPLVISDATTPRRTPTEPSSQVKDATTSPKVAQRKLSISTSADSLQQPPVPPISPTVNVAGGKKLSLMLPSAIRAQPVISEEDSPQKIPTKAGRSLSAADLPAANTPQIAFSSSTIVANPYCDPVNIDIPTRPRRLSSSEMPVPRRSSLKMSPSNAQAWSSKEFKISESEDESRIELTSMSSTDSLSSLSSTGSTLGNRRKSVSFSDNEVREYEPRAPPEETFNAPSHPEPQRYHLDKVERLPTNSPKKKSLAVHIDSDNVVHVTRGRYAEDKCCVLM